MPSFDVVSEVEKFELKNAVDQANREIMTRFDFRGTDSKIDINDKEILLSTGSDFQIKQMQDILNTKLVKRGIDIDCLKPDEIEPVGSRVKLKIAVLEGLDADISRKIVKHLKQSKMKIQSAIQGEQVRVSGKKRDDLQRAMQEIKEMNLGMPVQFTNFRD